MSGWIVFGLVAGAVTNVIVLVVIGALFAEKRIRDATEGAIAASWFFLIILSIAATVGALWP